jgi:hypothetical protein
MTEQITQYKLYLLNLNLFRSLCGINFKCSLIFINNSESLCHKIGLIKYWLLLLDNTKFFSHYICENLTYFVSSFHNLNLKSKHGLD